MGPSCQRNTEIFFWLLFCAAVRSSGAVALHARPGRSPRRPELAPVGARAWPELAPAGARAWPEPAAPAWPEEMTASGGGWRRGGGGAEEVGLLLY